MFSMLDPDRPALERPVFTSPSALAPRSNGWTNGVSDVSERRGILRHLAVASMELARSPGRSADDAARFVASEARLRAILQIEDGLRPDSTLPGPAVRLANGQSLSMVDLLAQACRHNHQMISGGSIDPDLIDAAKELLLGLTWYLPEPSSATAPRSS